MKKKKKNKQHNFSGNKTKKKQLTTFDIKRSILSYLAENKEEKITHGKLLRHLNANVQKDKKKVNSVINKLISKNRVEQKEGAYSLIRKNATPLDKVHHNKKSFTNKPSKTKGGKTLTGILDVNRQGVGYVMVEGLEEDIRISEKDMGLAFKGDTVEVLVKPVRGRSARVSGKIVKVHKRKKKLFTGKLLKYGVESWLIESDSKSSHTDFYIAPEDIGEAKSGEKVVVELISWDNPKGLPKARVIEALGAAGSNDAEVLSILADAQYRNTFPAEVESFTKELNLDITASEVKRRLDIRDKVIFTIDPADAKDFDDALSIELLENGNYKLGVHIADVSHYVKKGTVLDEEAYERATSVYLVDRVIPMLPEALSNFACSLRPNEDKYAYSCFMEITPRGRLVSYDLAETVIHSKHRFTYEQAQEVLDTQDGPYLDELNSLAKLADVLMKKRFREGSVKFETPEPRFVLDENAKPIDVKVKDRLFTHKLIEECMLMANKAVALRVDDIRKERSGSGKDHYPFFYRVHDKPDTKKLEVLAEYVRPLGIQLDIDKSDVKAKKLNQILADLEGHELEKAVNDLMVRAMAKAVYSPKNIGHFGLGFTHYAHFTSPIRRYPDVIVHRLLKEYEAGKKDLYSFRLLETFGMHTSEREKNATQAERESIKYKQVEYMSAHLGEAFNGVISGLTDKGIYILLDDNYCEGMLPLSELNDDYYVFNQQLMQLVGRSKGKVFKLGQSMRVQVAATNLERRIIDFALVD